jgi:hypothetical protein
VTSGASSGGFASAGSHRWALAVSNSSGGHVGQSQRPQQIDDIIEAASEGTTRLRTTPIPKMPWNDPNSVDTIGFLFPKV